MIDLRTFLTLFAVADLLAAAALWIGVGRGSREGLSHWAFALVLRALAASLCIAGIGHADGAIALAMGLAALSVTLQGSALATFAGRSLPNWIHTAVIAAVVVPAQLAEHDPGLTVLFCGVTLGVLLLGVAGIGRTALPAGAPRRLLVASFALAGAVAIARGAAIVLEANPVLAMLLPVGPAAAALLVAFATLQGTTLALLFLYKDRAESDAQRMAHVDALTGAFNRRAFEVLGGQELQRARRAGQPLSMIMLDIDHFTGLVKRLGQPGADALLARFVEAVMGTLRHEDMLFRFGGDAFLVLLPGIAGPGAVVAAGRLRRMVAANPLRAAGEEVAITVSLGVSARLDDGPGNAEDLDALLQRASSALQLAKQRGRDRVVALSLGSSLAA